MRIRPTILFLVLFAWIGRTDADESQQQETPIRVNSVHQLFVDDHVVADMNLIRRTVHRAEKFPGNPVVTATEPWENGRAYLYGTVLKDQDTFRMWYFSGYGGKELMLYATSKDGIHWEKPELGLIEIEGSTANNASPRSTSPCSEATRARRSMPYATTRAPIPSNICT